MTIAVRERRCVIDVTPGMLAEAAQRVDAVTSPASDWPALVAFRRPSSGGPPRIIDVPVGAPLPDDDGLEALWFPPGTIPASAHLHGPDRYRGRRRKRSERRVADWARAWADNLGAVAATYAAVVIGLAVAIFTT